MQTLETAFCSFAVTCDYAESPVGKVAQATESTILASSGGNNFKFSTKQFDGETGAGYWGYRYYHPETGRWMGRDPIGENGGLNIYGYVDNAVLTFVDPFGLDKRTRFLAFMVVYANQVRGKLQFTDNPYEQTIPFMTRTGKTLRIDTDKVTTFQGVLDQLNDAQEVKLTCGRTSSLVFLAAIAKFYSKCCDPKLQKDALTEQQQKDVLSKFVTKPSKELAANESPLIKLKPAQKAEPGVFGWWHNKDIEKDVWQDEGSIMLKADLWLAPGYNQSDAEKKNTAATDQLEKVYKKEVKYFELDFDAVDKIIGCNSDRAEEKWAEEEQAAKREAPVAK